MMFVLPLQKSLNDIRISCVHTLVTRRTADNKTEKPIEEVNDRIC